MRMRKLLRYIPALAFVSVLAGVVTGMYYLITGFLDAPEPPRQQIQQISLIKPPPPPLPPPKVEKPPEPAVEDEVKLPEPEQVEEMPELADEPPPGDQLGLDAEGTAGGDAFGLVGKKGGRGLIGGSGQFGWYGRIIKHELQRLLNDIDEVRAIRYSVVVRVWLAEDGTVQDAELASATGDPVLDGALRQALSRRLRLSQAPPPDLPQPIRLRITSRL